MHSAMTIGDRTVSRLGFGAMRVMGAVDGNGQPSREVAVALVRRAVELGATFIDTADIYGGGESEAIIAEALHPYADDVLVATKGGFVPGTIEPGMQMLPIDGRPERLRATCEASLRRLRMDRIPLYQLHTPDPAVPFEDSVGALAELKAEGKIEHIGISNVGRRHLTAALAITPIVSVQNRYNFSYRTSEAVVEVCTAQGIAFLPWGPIQTGDDEVLSSIAAAVGATTQQVALAWLLQRSPVMVPIPGTSSIRHLEQNMAAAAIELDSEAFARLDAVSGS